MHFDTDYMEGSHPDVMRRLLETNLEQTVGYGSDPYTQRAKDLIRKACGVPEAGVHFLACKRFNTQSLRSARSWGTFPGGRNSNQLYGN